MCVDDYEFRHYSARRQKLCRRFIFKTEEGYQRIFLVNISQFQRLGQLCLCSILMHLSKKGLNVKDYSFYLPQLNITVQAGDKCKVPFDTMVFKQVFFEMKDLRKNQKPQSYQNLYFNHAFEQTCQFTPGNQPSCCQECALIASSSHKGVQVKTEQQDLIKMEQQIQHNQKSQEQVQTHQKLEQIQNLSHHQNNQSHHSKIKQINSNETENKKHKQQQKTVEQALIKTKLWRMLYQSFQFSLKNAANVVQLSKKTLDDYFLVLRVAQYHGYNFKANLSKKIGHLRAFIRNQPIKVTGRLSKQVKSFSLIPQPDLSKYMEIKQSEIKVEDIQQQKITGNSLDQKLDSEMIPE